MTTDLVERRPPGREWRELPVPSVIWTTRPRCASRWQRGSVIVISTLVDAELPGDEGGIGPTWHVSISRLGKRPKPRDLEHALRAFDLALAEEDNHHPGGARHFFLPVDPARRGLCECKATEQVIVEPDGYAWTNPHDVAQGACRGCELERMRGKPCPIHSTAAAELCLG